MKLKTEETVIIKHDKKGNVVNVKTPYENCDTSLSFKKLEDNKKLDALYSDELTKQLSGLFKGFGESFNLNFNN